MYDSEITVNDPEAFCVLLQQYRQKITNETLMFFERILDAVSFYCDKVQENNICRLRFGEDYEDKTTLADASTVMEFLFQNRISFQQTYDLLSDRYSKDVLIDIWAYRVLGPKRYKLKRNNDEYWQLLELADSLVQKKNVIPTGFMNWSLDLLRLHNIGYPFLLYTLPGTVLINFLLHQYEYNHDGVKIGPSTGDIALDAGACWGETSLLFAHKVGASGKVISFEFLPINLRILQKNFYMMPAYEKQIQLIERALWDISDEQVFYKENGPGTHILPSGQSNVVTITIDDLVKREHIEHIDFIKMDIEGAELKALLGAEDTLKRFKPKLAICLYHKTDDFITIPQYLNKLNVGYKFYIDHFTIWAEETVLFACI